MSDADRVAVRRHEEEIRARPRARRPTSRAATSCSEPSPEPPVTHLLARGQATSPGPVVGPGVPAVLASSQPDFLRPDGHTTRRRLTLARWLTRPEHPLTARVIVNRVWQFHFGEGLVRTPSDFGTAGDPPTHPELLDWLADWFVNEGHWSLKTPAPADPRRATPPGWPGPTGPITRPRTPRIASSGACRIAAWKSRRSATRSSRAAASSIPTMYGPSMFPPVPRGALEGSSDPDKIWKSSDEREASRRTIYAFVKRSMVVPMIEVLDFCDTTRSAPKRLVTSTATQALALFNGDFVARQSAHFADRLMREAGDDPAAQVERAYRLALGRPPQPGEVAAMTEFLRARPRGGRGAPDCGRSGRREADGPRSDGRVIFNLNEFAYPD